MQSWRSIIKSTGDKKQGWYSPCLLRTCNPSINLDMFFFFPRAGKRSDWFDIESICTPRCLTWSLVLKDNDCHCFLTAAPFLFWFIWVRVQSYPIQDFNQRPFCTVMRSETRLTESDRTGVWHYFTWDRCSTKCHRKYVFLLLFFFNSHTESHPTMPRSL